MRLDEPIPATLGRVSFGSFLCIATDTCNKYVFRMDQIYIDTMEEVPAMDKLTNILEMTQLSPVMVDMTQTRFVDVYCNELVESTATVSDSE